MTRARFVVTGRVQGVGFRWFVQRTAKSLGVVGWVRNLPDGRVEATAEGSAGQLDQLEDALRRGPRLALVAHVEKVDDPHDTNMYKSFEII